MSDDRAARCIARTIDLEGGFVDDPADAGGATCWGITARVARRAGYTGHMREMPRAVAAAIYRATVWNPLRLDELALERAAGEIFAAAVHMGSRPAVRHMQRALNAFNRRGADYADVRVDGILGSATLAACAGLARARGIARADALLAAACNCLQGTHYLCLVARRPSDERFITGWFLHRVLEREETHP